MAVERIFWPSGLHSDRSSGSLYGYRSGTSVRVIGTKHEDGSAKVLSYGGRGAECTNFQGRILPPENSLIIYYNPKDFACTDFLVPGLVDGLFQRGGVTVDHGVRFTDHLLGIFVAIQLVANVDSLVDWGRDTIGAPMQQWILASILWIMGQPAGLKQNPQLTKFFGSIFLWLLTLWDGLLAASSINLLLRLAIIAIGLFGAVGGLSRGLEVTKILLSLLAAPLVLFWVTAARLWAAELVICQSLTRLFFGRKWNVLKKCGDSHSFARDELFLGTLLFALFFFTLPTFAAYYAFFLALFFSLLSLRMILSLAIITLRHFPTGMLLRSIFVSMPDSVYIEMNEHELMLFPIQVKASTLLEPWMEQCMIAIGALINKGTFMRMATGKKL